MPGLPSRYKARVALPCPFSYEVLTSSYSPGALPVELREGLMTGTCWQCPEAWRLW